MSGALLHRLDLSTCTICGHLRLPMLYVVCAMIHCNARCVLVLLALGRRLGHNSDALGGVLVRDDDTPLAKVARLGKTRNGASLDVLGALDVVERLARPLGRGVPLRLPRRAPPPDLRLGSNDPLAREGVARLAPDRVLGVPLRRLVLEEVVVWASVQGASKGQAPRPPSASATTHPRQSPGRRCCSRSRGRP